MTKADPLARRGGARFASIRSPVHPGWRVVLVGFALVLLMFGTRFCFGLYIKPLADAFGASRAAISGSQSLYMAVYAVFALIAGGLADRYGPKWILVGGALFMGGGMLLASRTGAVWHYYVSYGVLVAIGSGAVYVPVTGAVAKAFTRRRNLALGIAASGAGVGQYLIPPFVQRVLETRGWETALVYTAILVLAAGVTLPLVFLRGVGPAEEAGPEGPSGVGAEGGHRGTTQRHYTLRQAVVTRPFWAYFGMYFIICFVLDGVVFVHFYPYLTDIGFAGETAARALGFLGLISTATMVVFAPLGDRWNKRHMLSGLLALHTLMLLWLIHLRGTWSLWAFVWAYGILLGAAWPLTVSILADIFGSRSVSSILGACTMAFGLAGLVAPWMAGRVFDLYGSYHPVFYLTVGLSLLSVLCTHLTRKTSGMA